MVKPKPIFFFVPLKYLHIFLVVFLVLKNIFSIITSRKDVIYMFIWCYSCSPWHTDNLLDLLIFFNKLEPSPFMSLLLYASPLAMCRANNPLGSCGSPTNSCDHHSSIMPMEFSL